MKKKAIKLLSLLLALLLLSGCASAPMMLREVFAPADADRAEDEFGEMPRFENIPYERPDLDGLEKSADEVSAALDRGDSLKDVKALIEQVSIAYDHFYTMYTVAMIRRCLDTGDAFYTEEFAWCDGQEGRVRRIMEQMYYACAQSPLCDKLERDVFWEGFAEEYADPEKASYSPEMVELLERESELLSRYFALIEEKEAALHESLLVSNDYYQTLLDNYSSFNEPMAEIYIDMVRVRQEMARLRGYESYEAMAYDADYARDYSGPDTAAYAEQVRLWLVPLYRQLVGMSRSYDELSPLSERRLLRCLKRGARNMGGVVDEAFTFMEDYGLFDIRMDPAKADTGFQVYLDDYAAPYLFINPTGSLEDLLTFAHEFGHYVDNYVNGNSERTVDVAEIFSLTMEYLILSWTGDTLDEEEHRDLEQLKLLDTLELFLQQCSYNAFEQAVYASDPDTLDAARLNELSLLMAMDYGYYDGSNEWYYAMSWSDINHFFEAPFYVAAYPLACDLALQLYERELEQEGAGLDGFLELLDNTADGLVETARLAGLESPFADGRVERISRQLSALLLP